MKTILSLLFLAILIFCGWRGYKRGLIRGVAGLLAFFVSLFVGNVVSNTYSGELVDAIRPFLSGYIEVSIVDQAVSEEMGIASSGLSIDDYLEAHPDKTQSFCETLYLDAGLGTKVSKTMSKEAVEYAELYDVTAEKAAVEILSIHMSFALVFILVFCMMIILLTVIGNLINLTFEIPNFDFLNDVSGTIIGVILGILICMVLGWVLKFAGIFFGKDGLNNTFLVTWFMNRNLLVKLLGI